MTSQQGSPTPPAVLTSPLAPPADSALLLALFGALAYAASMLTHEALGHGGFCVAVGGHNTVITLWWENCRFPGPPRLGIKAAGPVTQYGAGLLAALVLPRLPRHALRLRCLLWLYVTFSLLIASSYVAFSSLTGSGDAAELVAPLRSPVAWRTALTLLGAVGYILSLRASAHQLQQLAGPANNLPRLRRFVVIPYLSAGLLSCCAAALDHLLASGTPGGLALASPGLNRLLGPLGLAAVSSFAATSGMLALPCMHRGIPSAQPALPLRWSTPWAIAAASLLLLSLAISTPGL